MQKEFLNYVVYPWEELNSVLVERIVFQTNVSRAIRLAGELAVAIRHLPEKFGIDEKIVFSQCPACEIMCDVGDNWKHGKLRKAARHNRLYVAAQFECLDGNFRHIRNAVQIEHDSLGCHDFLVCARSSIEYWLRKSGWAITWQSRILEGEQRFYDHAFLYFDPRYERSVEAMRIQFFKKCPELMPCNPESVTVAFYEKA